MIDQSGKINTSAGMIMSPSVSNNLDVHNHYQIECFDKGGNLKWSVNVHNLVVTVGGNEILDQFWNGSAYTAAHYVGLTAGTPSFAAGDTMASHAGWTEVTAYDEATREALTMGTASGMSINNSASKASFTMNASGTAGGSFVTTNSTKGGTTGILIGGAAFAEGNRGYEPSDVINVTVTSSLTSS